MDIVALLEVLAKGLLDAENKYSGFSLVIYDFRNTIPSLTVAKESRAHKRRNYAIYELLFSF